MKDMSTNDSYNEVEGRYNFGLVSGSKVPDKVVSWTDGILVGEVVNMSAEERILTDGKVDLEKLQPVVFDAAAMTYRAIGPVVGQAWGSGKVFTE